MKQGWVSVIIPTFNRCEKLREAVASVQAQTYTDYDLIIVDDGSNDNTGDVFSGRDDLNYIKLDHRSFPSAARNRGVAESTGEFVAFLDSDDLWVPEKLEKQIAYMQAHSQFGLCHTQEQWVRNGKKVNERRRHKKNGGDIFERSLELCLISPSAVMCTRKLYEEYGGFNETLEIAEDYHLWLRVTAKEEIGFIDEKLTIKHGGHSDQLSGKYGHIEVFRIQALELLFKEGCLTKEQDILARQMYKHKCTVYAKGCQKRGRIEEAERFFKKAD